MFPECVVAVAHSTAVPVGLSCFDGAKRLPTPDFMLPVFTALRTAACVTVTAVRGLNSQGVGCVIAMDSLGQELTVHTGLDNVWRTKLIGKDVTRGYLSVSQRA